MVHDLLYFNDHVEVELFYILIGFFLGFIFLAGHSSLMSHFVLYFPDIMKQLLIKNPTFDSNVRWAIEFTVQAKLIKEDKLAKPFNLVRKMWCGPDDYCMLCFLI